VGFVIAGLYVLACVVVGLAGTRRSMGFWGAFFLSFLITPFVMILVLQLTRRSDPPPRDPDRSSTRAS
jgi:Na+-transporting methylmalonyl-CoA/oxaloacetate decarboxylase gamma subunit